MQTFSASAETNVQMAKLLAETSQIFANELGRFRAWESVLYLFFARYYFGKADPISAATYDRDFLAGLRRESAGDEVGAQDIEQLYGVLFTMVKAAQQHSATLLPPDEDEAVM